MCEQTAAAAAMLQSIPKLSIGVAVAAVVIAAAYLYAVRGEALLLDLAGLAGGLICY